MVYSSDYQDLGFQARNRVFVSAVLFRLALWHTLLLFHPEVRRKSMLQIHRLFGLGFHPLRRLILRLILILRLYSFA